MFSRAVGREGHCRQISLACVASTRSVLATLGLPLLTADMCALPVYTAQAPACSIWSGPCVACGSSFRVFHKSADWVGPVFCAFPDLCLPAQAARSSRSLRSALSPGVAHLLPSAGPASVSARTSWVHAPCVCSLELASGCDPPGECQPSRILGSLWLETGSLW